MSEMKTVRRHRGQGGWVVDYKTLEMIAEKASQTERVSMEGVESVILALVDANFVRMEGDHWPTEGAKCRHCLRTLQVHEQNFCDACSQLEGGKL